MKLGILGRTERETRLGRLKLNKILMENIRSSNLFTHLGGFSNTVRRIARSAELQETKFEELLQIVLVLKKSLVLYQETVMSL